MIGKLDTFLIIIAILSYFHIYFIGNNFDVEIGAPSHNHGKVLFNSSNKSIVQILQISDAIFLKCRKREDPICMNYKRGQRLRANLPIELFPCANSDNDYLDLCTESKIEVSLNSSKWLRKSLLKR